VYKVKRKLFNGGAEEDVLLTIASEMFQWTFWELLTPKSQGKFKSRHFPLLFAPKLNNS